MFFDLVSVIVPVYNVEKYLENCLNSIVSQTYQNLEIILVDDGSTDKSGEIIASFSEKDSRIKVIRKENGGISSARNAGLRVAEGAYLCFVDADDRISRNFVEKMHKEILASGADLCMCGYEREGRRLFTTSERCCHEEIGAAFYKDVKFSQVVWSKLYRRKLLDGLFFDESKAVGEDDLYITQVLSRCSSVSSVGEALYHYTINYNGATLRKFDARKLDMLPVYVEKLGIVQENWPESFQYVLKTAVDYFIWIHMEFGMRNLKKDVAFTEKLIKAREGLYWIFQVNGSLIERKDLDKIEFYVHNYGSVLPEDKNTYRKDKLVRLVKDSIKKQLLNRRKGICD